MQEWQLGEYIIARTGELQIALPQRPQYATEELTVQREQFASGERLLLRKTVNRTRIEWELALRLQPAPAEQDRLTGVSTDEAPRPGDLVERMSPDEFNRLVHEGALHHPLPLFMLTRAHLALFYLVEIVPGAAQALREWARQRDEQDRHAAELDAGPGEPQ